MFKLSNEVPIKMFEEMVKDARMVERAGEYYRNSETSKIFLAFVDSEKLLDPYFISNNDILDKIQVFLVGDDPEVFKEGEESGGIIALFEEIKLATTKKVRKQMLEVFLL